MAESGLSFGGSIVGGGESGWGLVEGDLMEGHYDSGRCWVTGGEVILESGCNVVDDEFTPSAAGPYIGRTFTTTP